MKKKLVKKLLAGALVAAMAIGSLAGCGGGSGDANADSSNVSEDAENSAADDGAAAENESGDNAQAGAGGTIMWLSYGSSGIQYDACVALAEDFCAQMGYKFKVVYGDTFNDPAGNLNAVKNGMTKDVVALIASQDGGIQNIMDEYPDLYVVGYNTDLAAVYSEGGAANAVQDYEKFLGCICDGYSNGADDGKKYFDTVVEKGYKKVALMAFPGYAYPQIEISCNTFRELVDEYNATAADGDKIEVVGDTKVLEFMPLDESWFLEEGNGDLDAIVAACSGVEFVYPAMKSAMSNGSCSPDTKLVTSGFTDDEALVADIGGEGVIQAITISPIENMYFAFILIDNALNGTQYADLDAKTIVDSIPYKIDSKEDIDNVMSKSFNGTKDITKAQITMDDVKSVMTRFNPDATYADLKALMASEKLYVEALADK